MKLYAYTITEKKKKNPWTDNWETKITGVTDEPVSYFYCDEVQVWEDGSLVFSADRSTKGWNDIHKGE